MRHTTLDHVGRYIPLRAVHETRNQSTRPVQLRNRIQLLFARPTVSGIIDWIEPSGRVRASLPPGWRRSMANIPCRTVMCPSLNGQDTSQALETWGSYGGPLAKNPKFIRGFSKT